MKSWYTEIIYCHEKTVYKSKGEQNSERTAQHLVCCSSVLCKLLGIFTDASERQLRKSHLSVPGTAHHMTITAEWHELGLDQIQNVRTQLHFQ